MKLRLLTICIAMTSFAVHGTNMKAPIGLPTAKTLPKGVRNVNFKGVIAGASEKFNGAGMQRPLADPMFQQITFGDLILGKKNPVDKAGIEAKMLAIGATEDTVVGQTIGQVNAKPTVSVPIFAIGITNKWTAAIAVPIMKYSLNVDSGVIQNEKMYNSLRARMIADGLSAEVEELDRKFAAPLDAKIEDYGYKPLANEKATKLGDIALVNKYKIWEDSHNALTLTGIVILPTGKELDPDKIVDIAGGDGQTDLGFGVNHDYYFAKYFTFSSGMTYINQLADTVERRVPEQRKSTVSEEKDTNIDRDLGDILQAQVATGVNYRGYSLGFGYSIGYKQGDSYEGSQYEAHRYDWLSKDSIQNLQTFTAKIGYDTITLFKEKKFAAPLAISLTHTRPLEGKNIVKDPLTVLDFSMFF
jgi:hypothetical protein